ncbi:MAG: YggS family pyridoxal phosphate-dependent enzyme [Pseudomonadota bacterium]
MTDSGFNDQTAHGLESPPRADAYRTVQRRLEAAADCAGRRPAEIGLLAVSKGHPATAIEELARLGQRDFGESYLQEALPKIDRLDDQRLIWHFIGPLQSNKCRDIAARFEWVHSLDRPQVADRLDRLRPAHLPPLQVCLQVKLSPEPQKSGVEPSDLLALARHVSLLPRLRLRGLMTIPQAAADPAAQRAVYARLKALFERLQQDGYPLDTLSMGMSDDLEAAILEGSTLVRVGSALFGPRSRP